MSNAVGATIAAFFTLAALSFLYRDNKIYKLAEHIFVGLAAGYYLAIEFHQVFRPNLWDPLAREGRLVMLVPLGLTFLLFTRLIPRIASLSRIPMAILIGAYAGLAAIGFAQGDLLPQIGANMVPLWTGSLATSAQNWILLVGLVASLFYFFFSVEHRGTPGVVAKIGIYFLMVSFGASYGFTVMSRISLLLERLTFLIHDWPRALGFG